MAVEHNRRDDDASLNFFQAKIQYIKRNGFLGFLVVLSITMAQPAYEAYNSWNNNITVTAVNNAIVPLFDKLKEIRKELVDTRILAVEAHTKNRCGDANLLQMAKDKVWSASFGKCLWLLDYMDNSRFERDKVAIRHNIEPELMRRTMVYVTSLNKTIHPRVGLIGKYLANNFEWAGFVEEVVNATYEDRASTIRMLKIVDIMKRYQNKLWFKLERDMRTK